MTSRHTGFFWPLGARVFLLAGAILFGATLLRTGESLAWPYQEWAHTNGLMEAAGLDFTAPLAAAFGAFLAGRLTPPSRMFALPRFARDSGHYLAQNLLPGAATVTAGYVLALIPVLIQTSRTATAESMNPVHLVTGALVLNTFFALGWLLGLLTRSAFTAPVAFAIAFGVTLVGYGAGAWNAVTPVVADLGVVGVRQAPALTAFRLSFYFVVLAVTLITAAMVLGGRGFAWTLPLRHLALWLVPTGFVVIALVHPPATAVPEANPPRVCRTDSGIEYCLHQAHEKELDRLVEEITPVLALTGAENMPYRRIHEWSLHAGTPSRDPQTYDVTVSAEYGVAGIGTQIIYEMSGLTVCSARPGREEGEQGQNAFMLSNRLEGDREVRPDNRFAVLDDAQLRQWLNRYRTRAAACEITSDLLP